MEVGEDVCDSIPMRSATQASYHTVFFLKEGSFRSVLRRPYVCAYVLFTLDDLSLPKLQAVFFFFFFFFSFSFSFPNWESVTPYLRKRLCESE